MISELGILVHPGEVTPSWEKALEGTSINLLGIHPVGGAGAADSLASLLQNGLSPEEQAIVARLRGRGVKLEYELHAVSYLIPRSLFATHPTWFRLDENGNRTPDGNFCPSNRDALDYLTEQTAKLTRALPNDTHRYHFWTDDLSAKRCHCADCRRRSDSDLALIVYNAMLRGVKQVDPQAKHAYLSYFDALECPKTVEPEDGIFLEYAPIRRDLSRPFADPDCEANRKERAPIADLLSFFGKTDSTALEYWLDNSLFSRWKKPPVLLKPNDDVIRADLADYDAMGFEVVTTFACFLGSDYEELHGGLPDMRSYLCGRSTT
jgi:hypothetical protein